ncbi:GTPase [Micromonospora sp. WMMD998]|uniref:GTPase n=1 Tax=Micromonospora sp. WMMD998 TaxID=3016092 RepID=UPI00249BE8C9|nr:GTPase [Micromonospora sp. WMMD998]WFE42161.1 GTPase [Micromonospora sp. WMMD998]
MVVGAVVVGVAVGGAVVAGGLVVRGGGDGVTVGRGDAVALRLALLEAPPGVAEVAAGRDGAGRAGGGATVTADADGVTAVVVGDADGVGAGFSSSVLASTNGMTASGVTGPPAKLTPTKTV